MQFDDFAGKLRREYELYLMALSGRYLSYVTPGVIISPSHLIQFKETGTRLRETFLSSASRLIDDYAVSQPSARIEKLRTELTDALQSASKQNVATMIRRLKGGGQDLLSLLRDSHGGMGQLVQAKHTEMLEFSVTTKSGRAYKAAPLIQSQARQFAYQAWVDAEATRLALESDIAEIQYLDPEHEGNGMLVSISGNSASLPSLSSVKAQVFHYNSTALIARHVHS